MPINKFDLERQTKNGLKKRAIIFARVSSREQEQGQSIDAQLNNLREYCKRNDFDIIKQFSITESSTKGDRKKFIEMLDFVKKQPSKIIIVADCVDRIQRSFRESIELGDLADKNKIEIHFVRENLIISAESNTSDRMRWDFSVMAAKTYVGNLRDNVKRSMQYNWNRGKWQGYAPLGYINTIDPETKKTTVELDPERAPLVKKLFEEYATGMYSLEGITQWARIHNLTTRGNRNHPPKPLSKSNIYLVLQKEFYHGIMIIKGKPMPHNHPKLISKELFDKVQDILNGKSRLPAKNRYGDSPFIFRGLVRCGTCGCTMSPELHTKKSGKQYTYLKCSHLHKNCNQKPVNEQTILQQLERELFGKFRLSPDGIKSLQKEVRKKLEQESDFRQYSQSGIRANISKLNNRKQRMIDIFADGDIDKDTYRHTITSIDSEISMLNDTLLKYEEADTDIAETVDNIIEIAGNPSFFMQSSKIHEKRALLNLLFSNSTINGKSLCFSLKKPFDLLLNQRDCSMWWEWLDSNQLRLKPTDLQSAPALQLRRTPNPWCGQRESNPHFKLGRLAY